MRISDWSSDVCSSACYVPAHDLDDALWDAILTVNLKSYFWMVKRCVPMMQAKGQGVIINTASVQGLQSQKGAAAYAASKRSEEHTSELQSLMRISYAVFCLKKKKQETPG